MRLIVDRADRYQRKLRPAPVCLIASMALACASVSLAQTTPDKDAEPTRVRAAPLSEVAIKVDRSVPATAVSLRQAIVASELAAPVSRFDLVPGDIVTSGDVVAELDCRDSQLALESARSGLVALEARRSLASQQLGRLNKLSKSQNATEEQISQRAAELAIVKAEIATQSIAIRVAERQVTRCEVRAPFSGLVTDAPAQLGNYLTPGMPVVTLVDIERIELSAALLESQVNEIITSPPLFEFGGRQWPLSVRTVFPVVDEATQTREIRFNFIDDKPPPGAIGRLAWRLSGLTIPTALLVSRGNQTGVFVLEALDKSRVRFLPIEGARPGQPANVGLPAELMIITDGRFGLQDGQEVSVETP